MAIFTAPDPTPALQPRPGFPPAPQHSVAASCRHEVPGMPASCLPFFIKKVRRESSAPFAR